MSDGQVEWFNHILAGMLSAKVGEDQHDWDLI